MVATMSNAWIKLYIDENDENPSVFGIYEFYGKIDQLNEKIKKKEKHDLRTVDAPQLKVYAAGTTVPIEEGNLPIDPWHDVPRALSLAKIP